MTTGDSQIIEFAEIVRHRHGEWSADIQDRIIFFYSKIIKENEVQNLTRLTTPNDFYFGNVVDAVEFNRFLEQTEHPVLDIGTGAGLPGLICAALDRGNWILTDSEKSKARFVSMVVDQLRLDNVKVFSDRAEILLGKIRAPTVISRAVGSVEKIYGQIKKCSTWNKMVLFKGPGWDEEWVSFLSGPYAGELQIDMVHPYLSQQKQRRLIFLKRVPRGTKK